MVLQCARRTRHSLGWSSLTPLCSNSQATSLQISRVQILLFPYSSDLYLLIGQISCHQRARLGCLDLRASPAWMLGTELYNEWAATRLVAGCRLTTAVSADASVNARRRPKHGSYVLSLFLVDGDLAFHPYVGEVISFVEVDVRRDEAGPVSTVQLAFLLWREPATSRQLATVRRPAPPRLAYTDESGKRVSFLLHEEVKYVANKSKLTGMFIPIRNIVQQVALLSVNKECSEVVEVQYSP